MNLETLFELFADAPDAVAKMRELVLELAVRGELSERRASDETDAAWLKLAEQLDAASRDTAENLLTSLVAELTSR